MAYVVSSEVRVRYAETDAQGVVYYANYFVWFEVARVNYFRDLGLRYADIERTGIGFVIAEASCTYLAPAHFDEVLTIRTWAEDLGKSSFALAYEVLNAETGQLLATGRTVQVFVNMREGGRPVPIPERIRQELERRL